MRRAERARFKLDRAKAIAAAAAEAEATFAAEGRVVASEELKASIPSAATWRPAVSGAEGSQASPESQAVEGGEHADELNDEMPPEDLEYLQLTFQEAFFLAWTMDCLIILDPETVRSTVINCDATADLFYLVAGQGNTTRKPLEAVSTVTTPPCSCCT